jgi:methionyl-tRNA formyltransferase
MGISSSARIVFAGSPEFAVPMLETLASTRHEVVAVLTQPDRPAGRGRTLSPGPVKICARKHGIEVFQPETLSEPSIQKTLVGLRPDLLVVVAYGLLLPPAVLSVARVACINVHASLLPRWRGAAPIQMAILSGDAHTGICIMQMEEGLDTGPVYACASVEIAPGETAGELHDRLAVLGARTLDVHLDSILDRSLKPIAQSASGVSYARRIKKSDARIDWADNATAISHKIRAYNPWPVAETLLDGQRLRCWTAMPVETNKLCGSPGEIVAVGESGIQVQTGDGLISLTEVQMPGKQKCAAGEFANGYPLLGKILGS